jgi:23S rRNA (adenine2030-N6)-methyltransferase
MRHYDHRVHAGNAGDVWKHFLLLEAANCLLDPDSSLVYAESHVGRPEYSLRAPGDWEGGVGRLWSLLPSLRTFCYFDILAYLNESCSDAEDISGRSLTYPGSARQVLELAARSGAGIHAEIWDIDPDVAASWKASDKFDLVAFHCQDGFSGIAEMLDRSPPGLLFIDPPYIDPKDAGLARRLLERACGLGWIVLWWCMTGMKMPGDPAVVLGGGSIEGCEKESCIQERFELDYAKANLNGGRWTGSVVVLAGADGPKLGRVARHMQKRSEEFMLVLDCKLMREK